MCKSKIRGLYLKKYSRRQKSFLYTLKEGDAKEGGLRIIADLEAELEKERKANKDMRTAVQSVVRNTAIKFTYLGISHASDQDILDQTNDFLENSGLAEIADLVE